MPSPLSRSRAAVLYMPAPFSFRVFGESPEPLRHHGNLAAELPPLLDTHSCQPASNGDGRRTNTGRQRKDHKGLSASSSKIGSNTKTWSARSCRCRAVLVDRSIAVSHERSLCDGHVIGVFDQWGAFPEIHEGRTERSRPLTTA